jgi:hypothetical protein
MFKNPFIPVEVNPCQRRHYRAIPSGVCVFSGTIHHLSLFKGYILLVSAARLGVTPWTGFCLHGAYHFAGL